MVSPGTTAAVDGDVPVKCLPGPREGVEPARAGLCQRAKNGPTSTVPARDVRPAGESATPRAAQRPESDAMTTGDDSLPLVDGAPLATGGDGRGADVPGARSQVEEMHPRRGKSEEPVPPPRCAVMNCRVDRRGRAPLREQARGGAT